MEFPNLGQNCTHDNCNKLDFLPFRCDGCKQVYCSEHYKYISHDCPNADKKDVQVPVCPLCGEPVPTPRNVSADVTVGRHIDESCRSEKKKIFTNRCTFKNCKKKELIEVKCRSCNLNYCLKHRHPSDHNCQPKQAQRELLVSAALNRQNQPGPNHLEKVQGNMSEDEALARALALSMQDSHPERSQTSQSIPVGGASRTKDKCLLS